MYIISITLHIKKIEPNKSKLKVKTNQFRFPVKTLTLSSSKLRPEGVEGVEGSKMPNFDFTICYRAGHNKPNAKNGRLI